MNKMPAPLRIDGRYCYVEDEQGNEHRCLWHHSTEESIHNEASIEVEAPLGYIVFDDEGRLMLREQSKRVSATDARYATVRDMDTHLLLHRVVAVDLGGKFIEEEEHPLRLENGEVATRVARFRRIEVSCKNSIITEIRLYGRLP